ncbi:MAG: hypothetical protein WDM76_06670 [Limisphaerales bacterium]
MGTLNMKGGILNTALGVDVWLGEGYNGGIGGTGVMTMTGGRVNIGGWLAIGRFGGIGDLELSGGSITMSPGNTGQHHAGHHAEHWRGQSERWRTDQHGFANVDRGKWHWNLEFEWRHGYLGNVLLTRLSGATGHFQFKRRRFIRRANLGRRRQWHI